MQFNNIHSSLLSVEEQIKDDLKAHRRIHSNIDINNSKLLQTFDFADEEEIKYLKCRGIANVWMTKTLKAKQNPVTFKMSSDDDYEGLTHFIYD